MMLALAPMAFAQTGNSKLTIKLKKGIFTLNNVNVAKTWAIKPVAAVLGLPSKQKDGFNKTHTYNNYGIVLFEKKDDKVSTGQISEFQVYFSQPEDKNDIVPSEPFFKGTFNFEGLNVTSETSYDVLRAKLSDYTLSESFMAHSYRLSKGGLYIYLLYNETELTLIKISIGKDNGN